MAKRASELFDDSIDSYIVEAQNSEESPAEQIDLQHYIRILRKFKWPIVFFTAAVTGLAAYYAYTATPIYRSTARLLIESEKTDVGSIQELVGVAQEDSAYYATQHSLLRSRALAERVVDQLNLWDHPLFASKSTFTSAEEIADGTGAPQPASLIESLKSLVGLSDATDSLATSEVVVSGPAASTTGQDNESLYSVQVSQSADPNSIPRLSMSASELITENRAPQTPEELRRLSAVANFMKGLTITPLRGTKLVDIIYESSDPVLAAQIANAVGDQYIGSYLDAKMEMTSRASSWLSERLRTLKVDLDKAEDRLIAFREENGLVDVGGSVDRLNEQELLLATQELSAARNQLSNASDLYREVRSLRNQPELLQSISAIQSDPLVQSVKIEQGQRQRELDELLNRYGQKHPRVVDANSRLASLDVTLQGHIDRIIGSIESNYQLLRQRVASIENKISSGKKSIQELGAKRFELESLEREVETKREIYDTFFSRMTEANSAEGLETANARISDFASISSSPIKPKKQLIIALAALGALLLSMLMAFLYEQLDDTIKGTADVEKKLGVKLLGILPLLKGGFLSRKSKTLPLNPVEIGEEHGTFVEAVNTARTALCLDLDDSDTKGKVVMITSSVPSEGKSTTSINLAYSLGRLERVLLIDCDLRRPSLAKAVGLDRDEVGLSNLIANTASARDCIKRGVFDGAIDLLPAGSIPEQPLELLSSYRFAKILEQLSQHYDRIVIDTAPTQAVSDALVLSKLSDAVIYIVKSHETRYELVKRGLERLKQVKANIAGVIITQVDVAKITAYSGDYYYQGYYDYYGYRDENANDRLHLSAEELQQIKTDTGDVELDLDFSSAQASDRQPRQDPHPLDESEFDFTAELDVASTMALDKNSQRRNQTRPSFDRGLRGEEDLDII